MVKALTLSELKKAVETAIAKYGDKKILLAADDEGNEFRPMYYAVTPIAEDDADYYRGVAILNKKENILDYVIVG